MVKHIKGRDVNGIFLLDKPLGLSSNKALQKVKYYFQAKKAGHTGSLDPLATGVLPICLGEATKFSQYLLDADKGYLARIKFGVQTTTGDIEGDIVNTRAITFGFDNILSTLENFLGELEQVPSMFSAIKQNGQPLYKLARKGIEVERAARKVVIHELSIKSDQTLFQEQQAIDVYVNCSKGTYIRNLAEDIGEALNCGAHLLSLRRVKAGQFEGMHELARLELNSDEGRVRIEKGVIATNQFAEYLHNLDKLLLPIDAALIQFPKLFTNLKNSELVKFGRVVREFHNPEHVTGMVRLYEERKADEEQLFLGLGEINKQGELRAHRLLKTN